MIDSYTLKARFYPVIILFFPFVVLGFFYSFEFDSTIHFLSSLGLLGALTYLFSQIGRDMGKKKEEDLWKDWNGAPSTQLLRLSDTNIDGNTKSRYHQKLQILFPVATVPDQVMEANSLNDADEVYRAWTKFLITKTRDTKKFYLLFKENISYGFRRNLWGLKEVAIIIISSLLVLNYAYWLVKTKEWNPDYYPNAFTYSSIGLILILIFWLFKVTKVWIKPVAFAYAHRLCEAIEDI